MLVVFTAFGFIGGNTDIVECAGGMLEVVDLFADKVRFELAGTPAHPDSRPAVSKTGDAEALPVFNTGFLLFWLVEHQPFKPLGMA